MCLPTVATAAIFSGDQDRGWNAAVLARILVGGKKSRLIQARRFDIVDNKSLRVE